MDRDWLVDVAMRSGTMDDIAQSVVNLSNHIISSLAKTSRADPKECSASESGDFFEGTLGFTNHAKFLQNLCGGERSRKRGEQASSWVLARIRPTSAGEIGSKHEKWSLVSENRNASLEAEKTKENSGSGTKLGRLAREESSVRAEEFPSLEGSRSAYSTLSETFADFPADTELSSGAAVSREDLGRATWTFLHTLAAQFPENPTRQQQRDAKELMGILSRIYPCKECADHFKDVLKAHPVETKSGEQLSQWMCRVHNVVNRSLGKTQFPCHRVDLRWGALDCNEGACDLKGRLYR